MASIRDQYLEAMGISVWVPRGQEQAGLPGSPSSDLDWNQLQDAVRDCTLCGLHRRRTQTVFGGGSHDADLLIIGEAPGAEEDRRGEPFVGRAGQLLNAMLGAIQRTRPEV